MAISTTIERPLRRALLLSFIPAIALLVPAGLSLVDAYLGFIGIGFTVITSSIYLVRERRRSRSPFTFATTQQEESRTWGGPDIFIWIMDFFTFGAYIGVLVPIWIHLSANHRNYYYWRSEGSIMTVTYSTVPLMSNMVLHLLLFLVNARTACHGIVAMSKAPEKLWFREGVECPHCHLPVGGEVKGKEKETAKKGEGYSLLRAEEYDEDVAGRASEETTALNVLDA